MIDMKKIKKKTTLMKYIEMKEGAPIEELLYEFYIEKEMTIKQIATSLEISINTVNTWLRMAEIDVRLPHHKLLELVEIRKKLNEKGE